MKKTDWGAYIFEGGEEEMVVDWMWACFVNMPLWHRIIFAIDVILLRRPK